MAQVSRFPVLRHLRADPNQFVLHYRAGKLVRSGVGLAYWFRPLSASVAQVPVEDIQTTFVMKERSQDFQEVTAQVTLTYRCGDPEKVARRVNFSISIDSGLWIEQPLERLAAVWAQWARPAVRACLSALPVAEAARSGAERVQQEVERVLRSHAEAAAMGLSLVAVEADHVAPSAELEKALQTPARESIQQLADQATFERRALAVEKERAIQENELKNQIEMARRQEELIRREGDNAKLGAQQDAERGKLQAQAQAEQATIAADGSATARRLLAAAEAEGEAARAGVWRDARSAVIVGLALQRFADKVESINQVNLAPDLLGQALERMLRDGEPAGK